MKKLIVTFSILIPLLGNAQTKPVYYYDSLGNEYHYDPTKVVVEQPITPKHTKKSKPKTVIITDRRKKKYILKY
jgi:hypothetical protein